MLNRYIIIPRYDRGMMVPVNALWPIATILPGFVVQIIGREGLSRQDISAVPFIAKHLNDGV